MEYTIHHGDCIPHMAEMPRASVDLAVFSPPFPSLYAYTDSESDIGNSEDMRGDAKLHLSFFYKQLAPLIKPGRVVIVHVMQIPRLKRTGEVGLHDFRSLNIRLGERAGLVYEYDWMVRKNPQALKNGTKVLTPQGWAAIETIRPGDLVIGSNGKPTGVSAVFPHESRQMYRVTLSDGSSVECDDNHLWQVQTVKGASRILTTQSMRESGVLAPCGDPRYKIPIISSPVQFDSHSELPIDPYTLGAIIGDGSVVSRGSVFITTESEIVERCKVPVGHSWNSTKHGKRAGSVATFCVTSDTWHKNDVISAVRELGLFGKRAWEKFVPQSYLFASPYNRLEILRGLMDTDGTIKTRSGIVCKFCTTSEQLAKDIQFLAQSLGGVARIDTEDNSRYQYKGETRTGRMKYLVSLRMPDGCNPFKMERKASRWSPAKKSVCRWIKSIEPTDVSLCTCIQVKAADKLYLTEHCIVTHNSQAIRTRSRELQFAGLETDRAKCRGTLNDYLIKFRAPGVNAVVVDSADEVTRNDWIQLAEGCWTDIRETDTLNVKEGRGEEDTKHICPLQLGVIERIVKLFTNPGELVFSPFTGIGSEGYTALKLGRRFYGCELKDEYYRAAINNCEEAIGKRHDDQQLALEFAE